jgi:hypothetical protein
MGKWFKVKDKEDHSIIEAFDERTGAETWLLSFSIAFNPEPLSLSPTNDES